MRYLWTARQRSHPFCDAVNEYLTRLPVSTAARSHRLQYIRWSRLWRSSIKGGSWCIFILKLDSLGSGTTDQHGCDRQREIDAGRDPTTGDKPAVLHDT